MAEKEREIGPFFMGQGKEFHRGVQQGVSSAAGAPGGV